MRAVWLVVGFGFFASAQMMTPQIHRPPTEADLNKVRLNEDESGCKDSALLARVPGCNIIQCDTKADDGLEILMGRSDKGDMISEVIDGESQVLYYLCPGRLAPAALVKAAEVNLGKSGFKIVYSGKDEAELPLLTAMKDRDWLQISTYLYFDLSVYVQTVLKQADDADPNADALTASLMKNERVTLHSVRFYANRAVLRPDGDRMLAAVAMAMTKHPDLKIRVESYSDDDADEAASKQLCQQRAVAIASWLSERGIDKTRLASQGLGPAKPLADNTTEEGRAKNRRVELVRF